MAKALAALAVAPIALVVAVPLLLVMLALVVPVVLAAGIVVIPVVIFAVGCALLITLGSLLAVPVIALVRFVRKTQACA